MKKWYPEDWKFVIEVLKVGKEIKAEECRRGLEPGDTFECEFGTPNGLCPTAFIKIFPAMEAVRCGGDLRNLGGREADEITFSCPDGAVMFRLRGQPVA
ncbi:MAG: TIGR04076 family protein [Chloroflexota bacterium]